MGRKNALDVPRYIALNCDLLDGRYQGIQRGSNLTEDNVSFNLCEEITDRSRSVLLKFLVSLFEN